MHRRNRGVSAPLALLASTVLILACGQTSNVLLAESSRPAPAIEAPAGAGIEETPEPQFAPPSLQTRTPPAALDGDLELLRVADPWHALPEGYVPADLVPLPAPLAAPGYGTLELRREAAAGLARLVEAARAAGHELRAVSAFRSYDTQVLIFERRVAAVGEQRAARASARPGHSEHQLGTTVDLSTADVEWRLTSRFGETPAGRWLAEHGHEHGWVLSYPAGKEDVTGYIYEPWHMRYLGEAQAVRWRQSGLTVTEYLRSIDGPSATPR